MRRSPTIVLGVLGVFGVLLLASCTPGSDAPPAERPAATAPTVAPGPLVARSNAIPTMAELLDIGLTVDEANCFLAEIDPDKTGELNDPDRFMVAFTACFTASTQPTP